MFTANTTNSLNSKFDNEVSKLRGVVNDLFVNEDFVYDLDNALKQFLDNLQIDGKLSILHLLFSLNPDTKISDDDSVFLKNFLSDIFSRKDYDLPASITAPSGVEYSFNEFMMQKFSSLTVPAVIHSGIIENYQYYRDQSISIMDLIYQNLGDDCSSIDTTRLTESDRLALSTALESFYQHYRIEQSQESLKKFSLQLFQDSLCKIQDSFDSMGLSDDSFKFSLLPANHQDSSNPLVDLKYHNSETREQFLTKTTNLVYRYYLDNFFQSAEGKTFLKGLEDQGYDTGGYKFEDQSSPLFVEKIALPIIKKVLSEIHQRPVVDEKDIFSCLTLSEEVSKNIKDNITDVCSSVLNSSKTSSGSSFSSSPTILQTSQKQQTSSEIQSTFFEFDESRNYSTQHGLSSSQSAQLSQDRSTFENRSLFSDYNQSMPISSDILTSKSFESSSQSSNPTTSGLSNSSKSSDPTTSKLSNSSKISDPSASGSNSTDGIIELKRPTESEKVYQDFEKALRSGVIVEVISAFLYFVTLIALDQKKSCIGPATQPENDDRIRFYANLIRNTSRILTSMHFNATSTQSAVAGLATGFVGSRVLSGFLNDKRVKDLFGSLANLAPNQISQLIQESKVLRESLKTLGFVGAYQGLVSLIDSYLNPDSARPNFGTSFAISSLVCLTGAIATGISEELYQKIRLAGRQVAPENPPADGDHTVSISIVYPDGLSRVVESPRISPLQSRSERSESIARVR